MFSYDGAIWLKGELRYIHIVTRGTQTARGPIALAAEGPQRSRSQSDMGLGSSIRVISAMTISNGNTQHEHDEHTGGKVLTQSPSKRTEYYGQHVTQLKPATSTQTDSNTVYEYNPIPTGPTFCGRRDRWGLVATPARVFFRARPAASGCAAAGFPSAAGEEKRRPSLLKKPLLLLSFPLPVM